MWLPCLLAAVAGCGPPAGVAPSANVILISIDTLRPDHLGCYGYPLDTSPTVDLFRRDAVLFRHARAHAPSTLPSHASMFTSLLPYHHGASFALRTPLAPAALTVTEVLRDHGYRTAAFTGAGQVDPTWGLDQGFEIYRPKAGAFFKRAVGAGLRWLDDIHHGATDGDGAPFFLFLHTYEVHHPYKPKAWRLALLQQQDDQPDYTGSLPDEIRVDEHLRPINAGEMAVSEADLEHIRRTYDAEIQSMDWAFRGLIEGLKKRGLYDDALIVFTSDHGEEFGEHGKVGWHSHTLYEELLRVPLLIKLPGGHGAGSTVEEPVRLLDLAPTVLFTVGIEPPAVFAGDVVHPAKSRAEPATTLSMREAHTREQLRSYGINLAIHDPPWKLYDDRLFHLERDPGEETNVAAEHPQRVERLRRDAWNRLNAREPLDPDSVEVGEELEEDLRSLGYIQ